MIYSKIILTQKPDGRFGNDQLNFDDREVGRST